MARILMVASVALIAMSLCSVAYAQTVTVSPTVTGPAVRVPPVGGKGSGLPLPQFHSSVPGNAAATHDTSAQQQQQDANDAAVVPDRPTNVAQPETETENAHEEKKKGT